MTESKKMRSPNFPALPLEKCIDIAKILFEKYRLSPVAYEVVIKALNYSPKSSGGLQMVGAMSAYDLIEVIDPGKEKKIKVSQLAYKIMEDKRATSPERDNAIREAALSPAIFRKIYEDSPDCLPPEDLLEHDLKFKHGFNPKAVYSFIDVFTKTMVYANVYQSGIICDEKEMPEEVSMIATTDKIQIKESSVAKMPILQTAMSNEREIANYPVRGGTIRLLASGPITQKAIDKLIALLTLSKDDFPENDLAIKDPLDEK